MPQVFARAVRNRFLPCFPPSHLCLLRGVLTRFDLDCGHFVLRSANAVVTVRARQRIEANIGRLKRGENLPRVHRLVDTNGERRAAVSALDADHSSLAESETVCIDR